MFKEDLIYKNNHIPRILLGTAPFTAEGYFGHRSRLYQLDLEDNPGNIAEIIKKANNIGVKGINLNTNEKLLKGFDIAIENGVEMSVVGIIGKSDINYMFPDYEKAKKADWEEDINILSKYNTKIILIDEFITDSYDFELLENILTEIKDNGYISGIITSFPFKTTEKLLRSSIKDLFDFYMVPVNKLGYMMDTDSFLDNQRQKLSNLLNKLDKKVIINKILAAGIQQPEEAFNFLKTLDYAEMVSIGVSSIKETEKDFGLLQKL
ncbi:hypothetical protein MBFIL_07750 [Methanobrevibacter filiformis]|uniref:Uncharacterized protein n=1 Tax=Methanobrevibacter filiformis TaxID=55758 RepID=A0A166CWW8_9EURY|nr:hypothetical protein MBFIL_07750 [Methanobrevibacter filiformis]